MRFMIHGFATNRNCCGYAVAPARAKPCCRSFSPKSLSKPQQFRKTSCFCNTFATTKTKSAIRLSLSSEGWFPSFCNHALNYSIIFCQPSEHKRNLCFHSKRSGGSSRVWSVILLLKLRTVCWTVSTNATKLR